MLDIIAPQTILNQLHLEKISIEVDMSKDLGDGTGPDMMTITLGVTDLEMSLGVLLAIDQDALGNLELGSLLHMKNILPLVLSSMYQFEISQMAVSVGDIHSPTINGFVSGEVKTAISLPIDKIYEKYKSVMIESTSAIFDITLKKFFNRAVKNYINNVRGNYSLDSGCHKYSNSGQINPVDFCDLLNKPESTKFKRGTGDGRYGDIVMKLLKLVKDELLANDAESIEEIPVLNLTF